MLNKNSRIDASYERNDLAPLIELGLNKYEASIYLTLVNEGILTARDVSNITGVPYGKIYEMIDSLVAKGFVYILPSKPMKCQAVSPKVAVETARKNLERKLQRLETHAIEHLEPRYQSEKQFIDPKGAFLLMKGRANIVRKVEELVSNATQKINILTTENGLKRLVAHRELLQEASTRGVEIKITAPLTQNNTEDAELLSFCVLKSSKNLKNTMYSFDSKHTVVVDTIPDNENYICGRDLGVVSMSPSFSHFLDHFYETHFESSEALELEKCEVEAQELETPVVT